MQDIVIYGAGGFGREVLQVLHAINAAAPTWACRGFLVDPGYITGAPMHGLPVAGTLSALDCAPDTAIVVAIGNPAARQKVVSMLGTGPGRFPVLIHPRAWIGDHVTLGPGVIVCAGALVTTDILLGAHVHLNIASTVGHDCLIGDFCTIGPGVSISGRVTLGQRVEVGASAVIIPGMQIGDDAVIGAGAAVVKSIPAGCTAVGVPARVIKGP